MASQKITTVKLERLGQTDLKDGGATLQAVREAVAGEYELLAEFGRDRSGNLALLARDLSTGGLAALTLEASQTTPNEFELTVASELDASTPTPSYACYRCGSQLHGWGRFCRACGCDVWGAVAGSMTATERQELLDTVRTATGSEYAILGAMRGAGGRGTVYFVRELAGGQIIGVAVQQSAEFQVRGDTKYSYAPPLESRDPFPPPSPEPPRLTIKQPAIDVGAKPPSADRSAPPGPPDFTRVFFGLSPAPAPQSAPSPSVGMPAGQSELARRAPPLEHAVPPAPYASPAPGHVRREGPTEVRLGVATPTHVRCGEGFVARFAAYAEQLKDDVVRVLRAEAASAEPRLDLQRCRWQPGARVAVRLEAKPATIDNPEQTFIWAGAWQILRFDVHVPSDADTSNLILRFDVAVEGLPLVSLRPEVTVLGAAASRGTATSDTKWAEQRVPTTAFASYAREDRRDVLSRVRSLQIFADVDVFLDCLSIRPGEEWRPALEREIRTRDVFWLFWSRHAQRSSWVEWEWRQALASKSLRGIQPHPLEPADLAPPPTELSALQFGGHYEWYMSALRESWLARKLRVLRHRARSRARGA